MKSATHFFLGAWVVLSLTGNTLARQADKPLDASIAAAETGQALVHDKSGNIVIKSEINSELMRMPEPSRARLLSNPDGLQQLVSNLLVRRLLANEAVCDGLDKDASVRASLAMAQERILSDARLAIIDQQDAPNDAALEAFARSAYQAAGAKFDRPPQWRVSHILIDNKGPDSLQMARDLLVKLRAGASFAELARVHSIDTGSAARGGDLGFFSAGQMVRPFEDATKALQQPGDLSEPIETQFGYHIIRLDERREKSRQQFDEVRSTLIDEARTALANEVHSRKAASLSNSFVFDRQAIEALSKSSGS